MKRRKFIMQIPAAGIAFGASNYFSDLRSSASSRILRHEPGITDKVVQALLCLQRQTWEQGVAMQALWERGEEDMVILMAKDAVLRQHKDGRMAMIGESHPLTDAASPGEAVIRAAAITGDEDLKEGNRRLLEYMLKKAPRNHEGIIYHFTHVRQFWSDSNYMLPPYLAASGEYEEALRQIEGWRKYLWDPGKRLFSHMWDCDKNDFLRKDFWGVGNGWTAAGYCRVIGLLPDTLEDEKNKLINYTVDLLDACLRHMRPDGLFHNVIDDRGSFVETNLSQQLAYTIYRGMEAGWLSGKYHQAADTMRKAALSKVDQYGMVRDVCGSPEFDHAGTAAEGQAFHILMETAFEQYEKE